MSPDMTITSNSKAIMNDFIYDIFDRMCVELGRLVEHTRNRTLTKKDI